MGIHDGDGFAKVFETIMGVSLFVGKRSTRQDVAKRE
jgi:hypothetical protein